MSHPNLHNEKELLFRVSGGDEQAFRAIFDHYRVRLSVFAVKATTSEVAAEEIIQDVFMKIWINRLKLPEIERAGDYFFILTRNKVLDYLRRVASNRRLIEQLWVQSHAQIDDTDYRIREQEGSQLVAEALTVLSDQKQLVFRLSRQDGLSHEQIAERLHLSKSRVKNILVETLKHIKDHLEKHSPSWLMLYAWLFKH